MYILGYRVIIERAKKNYSAYASDLPGCISTGPTVEETKRNMLQAMEGHIQGMVEDGLPVPEPREPNERSRHG